MMLLRKVITPRVREWLPGLVSIPVVFLGMALFAVECSVQIVDVTTAPSSSVPAGAVATGAPGALPDMPNKPNPVEVTFQGCPPEGDGGDPVLNRLKNRVDEGNYLPVQFDAVETLKWPSDTERKRHDSWSARDQADIGRYEGIPLAVEGYVEGAREEGPESPNCHGADLPQHDFHIWLTRTAGEDRTRAIVVEMTPRIRPKHPGWSVDVLTRVAGQRARVRVSGWLMYDPEHPEQLDQTRGTLWEVHPITQVEVEQQGRWVTLDAFSGH